MGLFGRSPTHLRDELAQLEAAVESKASELSAARTPAEQYPGELLLLTTRLAELRAKIRARTPWRELTARRDQLHAQLQSLDPSDWRRLRIEREASDLDDYLTRNTRRRPMSAKALMVFAAIVLAAVVLPKLIIGWLAP